MRGKWYGNMAERSKALESGSFLIQSERAWVRIPLLSILFLVLCTVIFSDLTAMTGNYGSISAIR
jgi:hypothetical protein